MRMLSLATAKLGLGKKLGIAFGLMLLLMIAVTTSSLTVIDRLGAQMRAVVEDNGRRVSLAADMLEQVNGLGSTLRTLTLLTSLKEVDQQAELLADAEKRYASSQTELGKVLKASASHGDELRLHAAVVERHGQVLPLILQAAKLGRDGQTPEATTLLMKEIRPLEDQWKKSLGDFVALERRLSAEAFAAAKSTQAGAAATLTIVTLVAVILGATLSWLLTRSVLRPVAQATRLTELIASGDLSAQVPAAGEDEVGRLLKGLAGMQASLHSLVGTIRQSCNSIAIASSEIASGNADLSHRTEWQAASLQKTASNIEQLSGSVRANAHAAEQADFLSRVASEVAGHGGELVEQVVAAMNEITTNSKHINSITALIDTLAFQTNILALNAAVEAAQAGDKGRGFAVVADEVRNLAQRSAEAAKEIRSLLGTSTERVMAGAALVSETGATMSRILESISKVAIIINEITAASSQQRDGIEKVNVEMNQLDGVTQQNAALVEQAAAATESLKTQTQALAQAVSVFRLEPAQEH
jgi:methyl-accepting chemotaxis protein